MPQNAQKLAIEDQEITQKVYHNKIPSMILAASYRYCRQITQNHYENFPVASRLLPKKMRPAVEAIYAFSRMADDFADESEYKGVRLKKLDQWEDFLRDDSRPTHPVFIAIQDAVKRHNIPKFLLSDLLTAFKMDVHKNRYENIKEVLHYCRYSANPIGRLVLHLFKQDKKENFILSDYICTALQLTNFWQDVAVDLKKDRIYLPLEELDRFNINVQDLFDHKADDTFRMLMNFQVERTKAIFLKGKKLGLNLSGKLGIEIRLTWLTGMTILKKIKTVQYDVFNNRPTLTKSDFINMFFIALSKKRYAKFTI